MEPDSFNRQVETSSAFFQQMVDTSSAAIFIYQQDRFIYINAAAEQLSGYAHQELLDMPCWQVLHVADQAEAKQRAGMLQSGELDESHANVRFMKKDGSTVQVLYRTQRINYHGQTAICGMVTAIECRHHCVEQAHQRLNGRLVDAEVRLNRINFSNEQTIQTTMVDVAERKRTRGRLQRRLLIEQTLANISHQLLSIEKTDLKT